MKTRQERVLLAQSREDAKWAKHVGEICDATIRPVDEDYALYGEGLFGAA